MAEAELSTEHQPLRRGVLPTASRARDLVHALLLPMEGGDAILPNTAVAEVVDYREPEALPDAPDWLLGSVEWRERRIPLISFEAASGAAAVPATARSRLAVLNTLNGNPDLPYVAVLTQGIPQLRLLGVDTVEAVPEAAAGRVSVAAALRLGESLVLIPDLDDLERRVLKLRHG